MPQLVALALPGGPAFVEALQRVWASGDAAFPLDLRLPAAAQQKVLDTMAVSAVVGPGGERIERDGGRPVEPGDALVVATSGSTGDPKGVVLTHTAVEASAVATSRRLGVTAADHWLACLPLSHVGGLSVVTRALLTGTALTALAAFDPATAEQAAMQGATLVSLVATALQRIDAGLFRTIVLGGARAPVERPANVVTTYGMTETGSGVVYDGVPLEGVEVRLDGDGQILLRAPMLLRAYRDGSDPRDADGWFPTGDLGWWRSDGRLGVHGRQGDLIISGGENVWPEPVEAAVARLGGVADVAVAGVDDATWGQRVVAFVQPTPGHEPPTLDAVRGAVREELPGYCAPRQLVMVEKLPRTALGKLQRAELVARLASDP